MGDNLFRDEVLILKVELAGPKSKKALKAFRDALDKFVTARGGSMRVMPKKGKKKPK